MRLAPQRINTVEHEGHTLYMLPDLKFNSMMTTKNCGMTPETPLEHVASARAAKRAEFMTPETPTPAERMAHARAAKAAKHDEALAKAGASIRLPGVEVGPPPATTGGAPPPLGDGTPDAKWSLISSTGKTTLAPTPTTAALQTILRELGTMFSHATPRGQELVAQALALLEAPSGGTSYTL